MTAVPITAAARELGCSVRTLRRDIADGAPVVRRGERGRGHGALVDVAAIVAWKRSRGHTARDDRLLVLAAEIPEIVAGAVYTAFLEIDGPHKRAMAGVLAGVGYIATVAILDRLRRDAPDVPELAALPEKITALRHIFDDSRRLPSLSSRE